MLTRIKMIQASTLWAHGDQHRIGRFDVLINPYPVGGGAARGPDGVTIPDPEHLVNVRVAFG